MADRIPRSNLRRLLVGVHVEGKSFRLAASGHHLVHGRHRWLLCSHRPSRRILAESQGIGEGHEPRGVSSFSVVVNGDRAALQPRCIISLILCQKLFVGHFAVGDWSWTCSR